MAYCTICFEQYTHESWSSLFFIGEQSSLCQECRASLERIEGDICRKCGRPLSAVKPEYLEGDTCLDCVRWQQDPRWSHTLSSNRSVYVYNDFIKSVLATYKFRGDYKLCEAFRKDLVKTYKAFFTPTDMIVPIPLSNERLYERGFNQSLAFATFLGTPQELLTRKHHEKQSKKSRTKRMEAENPFMLLEPIDLSGKSVVIVDDIYTTGSTIRNAAEVILAASASSVSSLTLVRS
ncbi:ComF family protein [Litchfieldia alkalitelluris]|uniref:ComF family protein n=1 Tax=Litchfieldia alkalitelluris TaxID=304268 RepID=UPI00099818BA|nr:ComF family protein [Litchfieldia alkalitelluris]